jgi:hypothetical protein
MALARAFIIACVLWVALIGAFILTGERADARAHAHTPTLWVRYALTTPGYAHVRVVWFKRACISAEDSAAHLRLIQYRHGVASYGCDSTGY